MTQLELLAMVGGYLVITLFAGQSRQWWPPSCFLPIAAFWIVWKLGWFNMLIPVVIALLPLLLFRALPALVATRRENTERRQRD